MDFANVPSLVRSMESGYMKLLLINYEFPPLGGGAATATEQFAKELAKLGHEIRVLTTWFPETLKKEKTDDGYIVHRVYARRKQKGTSSPYEMMSFVVVALRYLSELMHQFHPDHVVAFLGIPSGLVAYVAKKRYAVPYTVMLRGGDVPGMMPAQLRWWHMVARPFISLVWRNANLLIANSRSLQQLAQKTATLLHKEVQVIHNGVDTELFKPAHRLSGPAGVLRIIAVGRVDRYKGFDLLLQAIAKLRTLTKQNFLLEIVGDGPALKEVQELCTNLALDKVVHFLGRRDREEVIAILQAAHIFVHPSQGESMSNAILEAMACGLPIIASDIDANRELIQDGVNGKLIDKKSVDGFSAALGMLLKDQDLRHKMGEQSRRMIQQFQWRESAARLMSFIRNS